MSETTSGAPAAAGQGVEPAFTESDLRELRNGIMLGRVPGTVVLQVDTAQRILNALTTATPTPS